MAFMTGGGISSHSFEEKLYHLRQAYLKKLSVQAIGLRRIHELVLQGYVPLPELQALYKSTHNFAGSGGTFGYPEISHAARKLHNLVKSFLRESKTSFAEEKEKAAFLSLLLDFEQECQAAMAAGPGNFRIQDDFSISDAGQTQESRIIKIIADTEEQGQELAVQLAAFNYQTILLDGPDALKRAGEETGHADIYILFSALMVRDVARIEETMKRMPNHPALIVVAPEDDFDLRLTAGRLSAKAFFTQDEDILKIVEKIEAVSNERQVVQPCKILIVDDDEIQTDFYSNTLVGAGMIALSANSARECMKVLNDNMIDLVLVDYDMPQCNGHELANVIRQYEQYVSLPIVFMSSKDDIESHLINSDIGMDDFLLKPFSAFHMTSVIQSRVRRAGELKNFMIRDSFTGLYNHKQFLSLLGREIALVERSHRVSSYVTIDIDNFKSVNDTYGHAMGDKVIKGLSLTLQQQLRRSDIIGRCGGEEFGIVMQDCNINNAYAAMEKILKRFSELTFGGNEEIKGLTFSGGMIELKPGLSTDQITHLADDALYQAKEQGRNRLIKI